MDRTAMKAKGFTLIELIVVVAIIGIIAAMAIPSYQRYVLESNRKEGQTLALDILRAQETFLINNLTYTADFTQLGYGAVAASFDAPSGLYQFTMAACAGDITDCVNVTATALGTQAPDGNLTINSRGARSRNGVAGSWD